MKVSVEEPLAKSADRLVADIDETKLIAHGRFEVVGQAQPPIISHPFHPLEKLKPWQMSKKALRQASEHNGPAADQKRNKLDWLELHITSSKKSPEQHPSLWANRSTRFNSYFAV